MFAQQQQQPQYATSYPQLSHSASMPSMFQSPQRPQSSPQQAFSPLPQSPLTTQDLASSPLQQQQQQAAPAASASTPNLQSWGGLNFKQSSQPNLQMPLQQQQRSPSIYPPPPPQQQQRRQETQFVDYGSRPGSPLPGGYGAVSSEKKMVPSHLNYVYKSQYTPDRSSPLATEKPFTSRPLASTTSRRVSFSPPNSRFGGPSFGIPKPSSKLNKSRSMMLVNEDDAPPAMSIYDSAAGLENSAAHYSNSGGSSISPSLRPVSSSSSSPLLPPTSPSLSNSSSTSAQAVIVFGFPSSLTQHIMSTFGRFGPIVSSSEAPAHQGGENWLKLTYADSASAARAVSNNGMLLGGAYMVGCVYATSPSSPTSPTSINSPGDRMDLDMALTPPKQQQQQAWNRGPSTPIMKEMTTSNNTPTTPSTPGRKLEVYGGEGIFITKASPQHPSHYGTQQTWWDWLIGKSNTTTSSSSSTTTAFIKSSQQQPITQGSFLGRIARSAVESIIGF